MLPNMDYSLIQRTPDGTGKILVTTPGSPDKGSYVLESDMKIYTNQGMVAIADIVDDLVTADAAKPLSANQGVVLKQLIDAVSGGIVPKGDILSSNLPPADDTNKGWQYYCTDTNKWATSDGTQWIMTSNNVITQTPDATDTGHALSNAVVTQCCNEVKGKLNQHDSRITNLEQKAGDYTTVQYRGTNAVPTGKAKYGLVKSFVGKSRAWNQLQKNGDFSENAGWGGRACSVSIDTVNKIATLTVTSDGTGRGLIAEASLAFPIINGHKYYLGADINAPISTIVEFSFGGGTLAGTANITANVWNSCGCIISSTLTTTTRFYALLNGSMTTGQTIQYKIAIVRDLTLIFGSGNEPSTVAEALAQLPALGQYNAYDAGSLVSTEVSGVKSVGRNRWNQEWEIGGIDDSTGQDATVSIQFRSVDYIGVKPNTTYYGNILSAGLYVYFYDSNKTFIGRATDDGYDVAQKTFLTPQNCFYIRFKAQPSSSIDTYDKTHICINVSDSLDGTFSPYFADTLSLSETVTLRSAGSVAEVLTLETGKKTRPISAKQNLTDIGFEGYDSSTKTYVKTNGSWKSPLNNDEVADVLCSNYVTVSRSNLLANDKCICINDSGALIIRDTSFTGSGDTFNGTIQFALATPTTESIDPIPDNTLYTEGGGTINTIQTQTPVIDNCLDVGYLAV